MNELLQFSLQRRLLNKTMIVWNCILFMIVGCFFFIDLGMELFFPSMQEPYHIYIEEIGFYEYIKEQSNDQYVFHLDQEDKEEKRVICKKEEVIYQYTEQISLTLYLSKEYHEYKKILMYQELQLDEYTVQQLETQELLISVVENEIKGNNGALSFLVITSIYFFLLSFSTMIANEIVYEKATKTLELILTSVSAKTHLHAKILTGWLYMGVQLLYASTSILIWFTLRNLYDKGVGFCKFVNALQVVPFFFTDFPTILSLLKEHVSMIPLFLVGLGILFSGMLLIQLVLVFLSSFVTSLEEASSLQAPFYFVLVSIYYITMFLNDPYSLTYGIGYYLSFVPVFSMLLMPCRLLVASVSLLELVLSFVFSLLCFLWIYQYGVKLYQIGVLDYANQGILHAMKKNRR